MKALNWVEQDTQNAYLALDFTDFTKARQQASFNYRRSANDVASAALLIKLGEPVPN